MERQMKLIKPIKKCDIKQTIGKRPYQDAEDYSPLLF